MPEAPTFLVDPQSDPALVRIEGRASFQNAAGLKDFFNEMIRRGRVRFVVDFINCASMDSTFLGVLAGAALQIRKHNPPGSLTLCRLGPRNLELVRNLGLHRLATVDADPARLAFDGPMSPLPQAPPPASELECARLVLEAHENLVEAEESNRAKFQDVLTFLRSQTL